MNLVRGKGERKSRTTHEKLGLWEKNELIKSGFVLTNKNCDICLPDAITRLSVKNMANHSDTKDLKETDKSHIDPGIILYHHWLATEFRILLFLYRNYG